MGWDGFPLTRRSFVGALALAATGSPARGADGFAALERQHRVRLGLVMRAADGRTIASHRAHERFLMCSTFKVILAAAVLRRPELADREIPMAGLAHVGNSPITDAVPAGSTLPARALCAAAVQFSDNVAANHLLALLGGPAAVTRMFRELGDGVSRLDRTEPELNTGSPAALRDTTTPAAMAGSLARLLLDTRFLPERERGHLLDWMTHEENGTRRIRAGMPANWHVANKPGTNLTGAVNDVAVVRSPAGKTFTLAAYVDSPRADIAANELVIALAARSAASIAAGYGVQ